MGDARHESDARLRDDSRVTTQLQHILPALTSFRFTGASEYLEDLISWIEGPQLNEISIDYFDQLVGFQADQLSKFIHRSVDPKLTPFRHAGVNFCGGWQGGWADFIVYRQEDHPSSDWRPARTSIITCRASWNFSHIAQVLSQFSTAFSNVVHLKLNAQPNKDRQLEGTDDIEWLHLLHQFSAMQTLHVSQELVGHIALALEDITTEMVDGVLPSLDLIYLAGQPASSIEKFIAARLLSGCLVTVTDTETGFVERLKPYYISE